MRTKVTEAAFSVEAEVVELEAGVVPLVMGSDDGVQGGLGVQVKSSLYINNRQAYGSLSNVLRKPAGEDGSGRRWRRGIHLEVTRHKC